jgi:predicted Zn-dependent protease with MMP-like domain
MERTKFEALVAQALDGLPRTFREKLTNVAIIVEDLPPKEPEGGLLLGLFHGIPRSEKSVFSSSPPDRIFLYQRNIEAVSANEAEVRRQVRATLLHEWGTTSAFGRTNYAGSEGPRAAGILRHTNVSAVRGVL